MARDKKNNNIYNQICAEIDDAQILCNENISSKEFISTGNFALDYIMSGKFFNGGAPLGRVVEAFGPSSTGKTVIGTHLLQGCQKAGGISVLIDSESAYSSSFGNILGLNTSELIYMQPETLEDCFNKIIKIISIVREKTKDNRPVMIVYDSIAASPSRKEYEEAIISNEENSSEMGLRARACSQKLRIISSYLSKQNACLFIVNQLRSKIGVIMGNPNTTAGGGQSLEYYCSVRLECKRGKQLLDNNKKIIGINMNVSCVKNKVTKPFGIAEDLELFFDYGISPTSGLMKILSEEGIIEKNGAWYSYTNKKNEEIKFQRKNFEEVLIDNPDILGSESSEQLQEYIERNKKSLDISKNSEIDEENILYE